MSQPSAQIALYHNPVTQGIFAGLFEKRIFCSGTVGLTDFKLSPVRAVLNSAAYYMLDVRLLCAVSVGVNKMNNAHSKNKNAHSTQNTEHTQNTQLTDLLISAGVNVINPSGAINNIAIHEPKSHLPFIISPPRTHIQTRIHHHHHQRYHRYPCARSRQTHAPPPSHKQHPCNPISSVY